MTLIGNKPVPGTGPTNSNILLVGEAPGADEERLGEPFVGYSGELLMNVLGRNGISRNEVRLDNLCHYRPSSNKFQNLVGSKELVQGILSLHDYLSNHRPNIIIALGSQPLKYLTGKVGIDRYRGSFLTTNFKDIPPIKVLPTYHPAAVLRDRKLYPIFDFDIRRGISDSSFPDLRLPEYNFVLNPQGLEREEWTEKLCNARKLAVDIEAVKDSTQIICVGFALDEKTAVVFPYDHNNYENIDRVLRSAATKVFHFGTYDSIMLELNGHEIKNYSRDTLVGLHTINPELPKSLAFATSIYTRQPYYKDDGRGSLPSDAKAWGKKRDRNDVYEYNAKDCCVTWLIDEREQEYISADPHFKATYELEINLIPVARKMSKTGMLVDMKRREMLRVALLNKWAKKQFALDKLVGESVNVRSPKLKDILYGKFKLPVQKLRDGKVTTNEDAIVYLIGYAKGKAESYKTIQYKNQWLLIEAILRGILEIRGIRQLLSNYILARISADNRIRSTYKVAGPETGRWAAEHFVDGSGNNAQTFPRGHVELTEGEMADVEKLLKELESEVEEDQEELEEEYA